MKLIEVNGQVAILLDNPKEDFELAWHAMHSVDAVAEDGVSYWEGQADEDKRLEDQRYLDEVHAMTEAIRQGLFPGRV